MVGSGSLGVLVAVYGSASEESFGQTMGVEQPKE